MQTAISCVLMRGGTSKGPFFLATDLPADPATRDRVLLAALGSPDRRQIDGIGGADPLTSKVAIIAPSAAPDTDVDYLFAQVSVTEARVDTSPNCGNMLAGVGPFAIDSGLVPARDGVTVVRIRNLNTGAIVAARVRTPGGAVDYEGECAIDGVPGSAAPIELRFEAVSGSRTGRLLPTGRAIDRICGIEVSCVDAAVPVVFVPAAALGLSGHESKRELDANSDLATRLAAIRLEAGLRMGMGDVSRSVLPKMSLVSPPAAGGDLCSRYFVPHACHAAHAATGAICLAAAAAIPDTVAARCLPRPADGRELTIEHPSGIIRVRAEVACRDGDWRVEWAALTRTARRLFAGSVYVPRSVWAGPVTRTTRLAA